MRATRSGITLALSLALVVPIATAAQEPDQSLVLQDATGDLHDLTTGEPLNGPAYFDLTGMDVSVDGDNLLVRFDVAENVPEAPDAMQTTVGYFLNIDTDGDDFQNYQVDIGSEDGWHVNIFDFSADTPWTPLGDALVLEDSLVANVPLSELDLTPDARFQGLMQATYFPDVTNDPLNWTDWEDRVPDDEDEWLALGEAPADATGTETVVALKSIDDLLATEMKPKGRKAIVEAVEQAYASDPTAEATEGWGPKVVIKEAKKCPKNPQCNNIVGELFAIYVDTGNPLFYDAAELVWASSFKGMGIGEALESALRETFGDA